MVVGPVMPAALFSSVVASSEANWDCLDLLSSLGNSL